MTRSISATGEAVAAAADIRGAVAELGGTFGSETSNIYICVCRIDDKIETIALSAPSSSAYQFLSYPILSYPILSYRIPGITQIHFAEPFRTF